MEPNTTCRSYRVDVLQCVAVCCSVLECVAVCCSVLQCVAGRHGRLVAKHASIKIGFFCVRYRALLCATQGSFWWNETRVSSLSSAKEPCTSYKRARYLDAGHFCGRERKKKLASLSAKRALYRTQKSPIPHAKEAYFDQGMQGESDGFFLPPTATPSNIKQHTLQHTLQHTTTHSNHCNTPTRQARRAFVATHSSIKQPTATHTATHKATHYNTLQHTCTL